jgi:hypothetical protein
MEWQIPRSLGDPPASASLLIMLIMLDKTNKHACAIRTHPPTREVYGRLVDVVRSEGGAQVLRHCDEQLCLVQVASCVCRT